MAGKILYREGRIIKDSEMQPRFRIVAASDVTLKVYSKHLRKSELEHMAQACNADLVLLRKGRDKAAAAAS
jgi:hypothetical protein